MEIFISREETLKFDAGQLEIIENLQILPIVGGEA